MSITLCNVFKYTVKPSNPTCPGREILCQNRTGLGFHNAKTKNKWSKGHENQRRMYIRKTAERGRIR